MGFLLSVVSCCYVFIFKAARAQNRIIDHVSAPAADRLQAREKAKHRKTPFTIGIIVGLFVLLFSSNFVFAVLVFMATHTCQEGRYNRDWLWGGLVAFSSSATNPWIYAIRMREFRKPMRSILRKVLPYKLFEEAENVTWLKKRNVKEGVDTSAFLGYKCYQKFIVAQDCLKTYLKRANKLTGCYFLASNIAQLTFTDYTSMIQSTIILKPVWKNHPNCEKYTRPTTAARL